jgi:hypothetical protein
MAAWTHIAHSALSLPAAMVTWTGISGSYDHLLIKISGRSARTASDYDYVKCEFNNDTTSGNYSYTQLYADSATPASGRGTSLAFAGYVSTNNTTADTFGTNQIWIPHYSNTANFKQCLVGSAAENASTTDTEWIVDQTAMLWQATAAITEIDLTLGYGSDNWMAYSTFDLYGITGA